VQYKLENVIDAQGRPAPLPKEAIAFCGIGNPERFRKSLLDAGVAVKAFTTFSDHMNYSTQNIRSLIQWKGKYGSLPMLTTLKDYVKLHPFIGSLGGVAGFEPLWVNLSLRFLENESTLWKETDRL
jgi:tetraacyldisaccharide 4'-kinase